MSEALAAGAPVRLERLDTIADGLAPPFVGELNLTITQRSVEAVVRVPDDAIRRAMRLLLERTKLLVEPAGAAALAALLEGKLPVEEGATVVLVLSGGNVDLDRLSEAARDRGTLTRGEDPSAPLDGQAAEVGICVSRGLPTPRLSGPLRRPPLDQSPWLRP